MRSPGNRSVVEAALRGVSVLAMIALAWRLWTGASTGAERVVRASSATLDSALTAWSQVPPSRAEFDATVIPSARERDWLVALKRTGSDISWTTADSAGSAVTLESAPRSQSRSRMWVVAAPNTSVTLSDIVGRVDSTRIREGFGEWRMHPLGKVTISLGATRAITAPRDSFVVKPALMVGSANWESKFVTAALEEEGWSVTTRITVAPGALVRQGASAAIDTASFSAVIVLDSTSALDARSVNAFVNGGGGLLAAGPGVQHPSLRGLMPRTTRPMPGVIGGLFGPGPRQGLDARGFRLTTRQVVLERRSVGNAAVSEAVVAAERVGMGRVLALGYDDTWRIRMSRPDEQAPAEHREWWSGMLGSVARVRLVPLDVVVDDAPFAATVAALGPPVPPVARPDETSSWPWDVILAVIAASALLSEWLSRRLRGVA